MDGQKKVKELMNHHRKEIAFYQEQIKHLEDQKKFHEEQLERLKARLCE